MDDLHYRRLRRHMRPAIPLFFTWLQGQLQIEHSRYVAYTIILSGDVLWRVCRASF